MWYPDLKDKQGPKYKRIATAIGESIKNGSLQAGDRLPPQRMLADWLDVSLNTVSRSYGEAIRRGFVSGEVGRGTYVRRCGPLPNQLSRASMGRLADGPIDLSLSLPAASAEAASALSATLEKIGASNALHEFLDYQTDGDLRHQRDAASKWISSTGLDASSDNIVLTNGAQHGLMAVLFACTRPGDALLTEALTYAPIKALAQHLGLTLLPVDMDDKGLSPTGLDAACRATTARTLYCLPTLHTPTTLTMSAERRSEVAQVAIANNLTIIEDDVFGFLPEHRPLPLASFAPQHSLYVTSVSKCLAPGLRVGYVHAPDPLCRRVRDAVNLSCWMPPPLMAEVASRWIEDGTALRLNEFQRSEAGVRQEMASRYLGGHELAHDPAGFHLWLRLPAHWRADAFRAASERLGVKLLTAEPFTVAPNETPQAVRLCLSHELAHERVREGLEIVARLLEDTRDPGALVL